MLAIVVSVRVNPNRRSEFLAGIEEASARFREEPGCVRFDVIQDAVDPDQVYFYEVWRDETALDAHRASPHLARWAAKRDSGLVVGSLQAIRCRTVFPREADWK